MNLQDTIKVLLVEAMDPEKRASLEAALGQIEKTYGAGKNNLGASIRKITGNAALSSYGASNHRKYVNVDGSLTDLATQLNAKHQAENKTDKNHPTVGGALYTHENDIHQAKVKAVIAAQQKEKK